LIPEETRRLQFIPASSSRLIGIEFRREKRGLHPLRDSLEFEIRRDRGSQPLRRVIKYLFETHWD